MGFPQGISTLTMMAIIIGRILGLLLGFTIHEWAHAYSAFRLGGRWALPNPERLSLDPRVHIDPIGLIMVMLIGFGWAKPVPVNPRAFYPNERRGMMIVAFAGPLTNIVIAVIFGICLRMMFLGGALVEVPLINSLTGAAVTSGAEGQSAMIDFWFEILITIVFLNLLLFFFNLLPLAPLDGWKVMLGLVSPETARDLGQYERESTMLLFLLIFASFFLPFNFLGEILIPPIQSAFEFLTGFAFYYG